MKTKLRPYLLILTLLTLSSFTSCGLIPGLDNQEKAAGFTRQFSTTESTFISYVETFENNARIELDDPSFSVVDVPINFGDTENEEFVGVCFSYSNGDKEIIIDKQWWDQVSPTSRESLIFHELGHCALNRVHNDEMLSFENETIRASVMHPGVVSSTDYNAYKEGYIHELFTNNQSVLEDLLNQNNSQQDP